MKYTNKDNFISPACFTSIQNVILLLLQSITSSLFLYDIIYFDKIYGQQQQNSLFGIYWTVSNPQLMLFLDFADSIGQSLEVSAVMVLTMLFVVSFKLSARVKIISSNPCIAPFPTSFNAPTTKPHQDTKRIRYEKSELALE